MLGGLAGAGLTVGANDEVPCNGLEEDFHSEGSCEEVIGNDDLQAVTWLVD